MASLYHLLSALGPLPRSSESIFWQSRLLLHGAISPLGSFRSYGGFCVTTWNASFSACSALDVCHEYNYVYVSNTRGEGGALDPINRSACSNRASVASLRLLCACSFCESSTRSGSSCAACLRIGSELSTVASSSSCSRVLWGAREHTSQDH